MPSNPSPGRIALLVTGLAASVAATVAVAAGTVQPEPLAFAGVPVDFILFGLMLLGVAVFHHHTLRVAVFGLAIITLYKVLFSPFAERCRGRGIHRAMSAMNGCCWPTCWDCCWVSHSSPSTSKASRIPEILPRFLPNDWKGPFVLLLMIFVLSSFLDNIAAAFIGGTIAQGRVPWQGPYRIPRGGSSRHRMQVVQAAWSATRPPP